MNKPLETAIRIIDGARLSRQDDLSWIFTCSLNVLTQAADAIRRHFVGDSVDLCAIINGRSGRCSEDCHYCAQSAHYDTSCAEYALLDVETIYGRGLACQHDGVNRYAIVTSGKALVSTEFDRALETFSYMRDHLDIGLCASLGSLTYDQLVLLRQAGVSRYHHNIETSRAHFPSICTTHSFDDRLGTIRDAQAAGLEVCSGGIVGMGETWDDRTDMAFTLAELGILSIPLNVLIPIQGTPLQDQPELAPEEILRTVALFRFVNPTAHIRMAGGRTLLPEQGRASFESGASAAIAGDMLTTPSSSILADLTLLKQLGRVLVRPN